MSFTIILLIIISLLFFFDSLGRTKFDKEDHRNYMRSDKWFHKRFEILLRDEFTCQGCGTHDNLEVHHISYRELGNEKLKDLVTVCRSCHQEIHDKYGYNKGDLFPLIKK